MPLSVNPSAFRAVAGVSVHRYVCCESIPVQIGPWVLSEAPMGMKYLDSTDVVGDTWKRQRRVIRSDVAGFIGAFREMRSVD